MSTPITKKPLFSLDEPAPAAAPTRKPVDLAMIEQISATQDFPSRQPPKPAASEVASQIDIQKPQRKPRRHTTGRNIQLNLKATAETVELINEVADELGKTLGEVLERAISDLAKAELKRFKK